MKSKIVIVLAILAGLGAGTLIRELLELPEYGPEAEQAAVEARRDALADTLIRLGVPESQRVY